MRKALLIAAVAAMMTPVVMTPFVAHAKDCNADPKAAMKTLEMNYKKAKKAVSPEDRKAYGKAVNKAKMAIKMNQNDLACESIAEAQGHLEPKK